MTINFSNDLGYGSVKGRLNGSLFKVPSLMVKKRPGEANASKTFQTKGAEDNYIRNYFNHMDVSINSKSITRNGRYLVGNSANTSSEHPQSFDVNNFSGKSDSDLSIAITLSIIASQTLRDYYDQHSELPASNKLTANVNMVTALPVIEFARENVVENYTDRYTNCDHTVTICNFVNPITVKIHFNHVLVRAEDQVAMYYIYHATPALLHNIATDFKDNYPKLVPLVKDPKELTHVKNTLSIDIGEGTTDFVVFSNGRMNPSASSSIQYGFGNVLEDAAKELRGKSIGVSSRSDVKDILSQHTNFSNEPIKTDCQQAIKDNEGQLIDQIADGLSSSIRNAKGRISLIYVYGGGAIPMASPLRVPLMRKTRTFRGGHDIPIIFIGRLAQYMNVNGLAMILNALIS